eukprot:8332208-Alexandrium_andersonii.AAC.1
MRDLDNTWMTGCGTSAATNHQGRGLHCLHRQAHVFETLLKCAADKGRIRHVRIGQAADVNKI